MKFIIMFIFTIFLSGCFVSNPYKTYSTDSISSADNCYLSDKFTEKSESYSCFFIQSEKQSKNRYNYFFATKVNGRDFNAEFNGSKLTPKGVQSIALPSNKASNIDFVVVGVNDGYGWSTNDNISARNFVPKEGENYIAKVKFSDTYKFQIWIEELASGTVVYGKKN